MKPPRQAKSILIEDIEIVDRLRHVDYEVVSRLARSISAIGLKTPITVRSRIDDEDGTPVEIPVLITGHTRLRAAKELGWQYIDAFVEDCDETQARLWEIAENLHRAELTVLEHDEHVAEWIRLTSEKSLAQVAPVKSRRSDGRGGSIGDGINAAVRELDIERTSAQRAVKVASISEQAKEAARKAGLDDNRSALLAAAKAPAERQAAVIHEIAERKSVAPLIDADVRRDAARFAAEIISEYVPPAAWGDLTANLYKSGAKNLADAFASITGATVSRVS